MGYMKKLLVVLFGIFILNNTSSASMLDQVIYNVVGQASNATGARLGDEIYYGSSGSASSSGKARKHRKRKKHAPAKRSYAPVVTDAMRVQKALTGLGFYRGKIDGSVNSFETRSAIKKMNIAYGISNSASLKPEAKDSLIFLGTLFDFDRQLISTQTAKRSKNRKIQVALKLHGYYHGNIDGAIGSGTRSSIAQYKNDNSMMHSGTLDFEEEYQLISSAKEKNDKNIEDSISSLEAMGRPALQVAPIQNQVNQSYVYQRKQIQQQPQKQVVQQPYVSQVPQSMPSPQVSVEKVQQQITPVTLTTPQSTAQPVTNIEVKQ